MNLKVEYSNKSRFILLFILIVYLLDLVTAGKLGAIFMLTTSEIHSFNEIWKIFTYPLKYTSANSLILFAFVFAFLSPNLENFYKFTIVPVFYFLIVASHGVVISLIDPNTIISGTDGISFFVLFLHFLLFKNYNIKILHYNFNLSNIILLTIMACWSALQGFNYYLFGSQEIINSFILAGLGITNAFVVYLQIYLMKRHNTQKITSIEDLIEEEDSHSLEPISASSSKIKEQNRMKEEVNLISSDPHINEERMNNILEKISDTGFSSLSEIEQKFLEEYSKKL
jgi:hypothetical protein